MSRLERFLNAIRDKNLYGRSFLVRSLFYLIFGLIMQSIFYFWSSMLIIYIPAFIGLILILGAVTKNLAREFHPMALWLAYLFFMVSLISKAFAYVAHLDIPGLFLVFAISEIAILISLISIAVRGQRASLRESVGLGDNFFNKEKRRWKSDLEEYQNLDKVLEGFDEARFVAGLFDMGLFSLTVLWSWNIIEKVTNAITDGIIEINPERRDLFRKENGSMRYYPKQLEELGYSFYQKCHTLREVRNEIAHRNYEPTFDETNETMKILVLFTQETPSILQKWSS